LTLKGTFGSGKEGREGS